MVSDIPAGDGKLVNQFFRCSWPGIIKLFSARESLVIDIPAGYGKTAYLFLQCSSPFNMSNLKKFNPQGHVVNDCGVMG